MINFKMIKGKKGATLSGWSEALILSIAFVTVLGIVIGNFNLMYTSHEYQTGFSTNTTQAALTTYSTTSANEMNKGEVSFLASIGMTLTTVWGTLIGFAGLLWNFFTGGWIETAISYMMIPSGFGISLALRALWMISVVFALIRIFQRVRP